MKKELYEEELYEPIKAYLCEGGFEVKGEVKSCDVTAVMGDIVLVVEMKTTLNLDVILQAAQRQKIADIVYVAVPRKSKTMRTKRWKNICHLLRRLEIGLLLVSFSGKNALVQEALKPEVFSREMSKKLSTKKRKEVLNEFYSRNGDFNKGGSTRKKLITAYREKAIFIAVLLKDNGALTIKQLKEFGSDENKTSSILQNNHYGWFERVSRGKYNISQKGMKDLNDFDKVIETIIVNK